MKNTLDNKPRRTVKKNVKTLTQIETEDQERTQNPAASAYRRAEEVVWAKLDKGTKEVITECRQNPTREDHIALQFAAEVIRLAEQFLNEKH